jgi:tetratricopeptide (TPR) repeat protein
MNWPKKRPLNEQAEPSALSAGMPGLGDDGKAKEGHAILDFPPSAWRQQWLPGFLLVAVTIIAYQPAWHAGTIWDDDAHITLPKLRSLNGLARIWTQPGAVQQYYPLVHSVFWVEHKLWGDATAGYHWVNILLHAFSALLLVKVLRQLKIPGAWLAAALFALHPVEVESVAWISELKNTLSGVFYLSAALAYLGFDRKRSGGNYAIALGLFLLGLMSKTVIASLPAALLVVFWWQRGKLSWKRDVLPLIPFFIAGMGAGLLTAWVERKFIGAEGSEFNFSIIERILIAGRDIWFYLGKLFWPVDLCFVYPRWNVSQTVWWQYLFPAAAMLLLGVLVWRRWRGLLAGLLFFVGTLFPALGFFNVYPFRYSLVADHFQYLASLGPLTLAAAGITAVPGLFRKRKPFLEPMVGAALLLVLGTLTWKQCGMYANEETLWQKTIRLNPDCWMPRCNLGDIFTQQRRTDEAIAQYQKALAIKPDYAEARYNLGIIFFQLRRTDEAIAQYQKALAIKPDYVEARNNLGLVFFQQGRMDEAISQYQKALAIKPDVPDIRNNLGIALFRQGRTNEAITQYQRALAIKPDYAEAHFNLGDIFTQQGRTDEAITQYQKALAIQPDYAEARYNLGITLFQLGRMDEAIAHFQQALQIKPDYAEACYNLGLSFRKQGRLDEAIACYQKALQIRPDFAEAQNNLGNALLQTGQVDAAISSFQKALEIIPDDASVHLNLGNALLQKGRADEAITQFQKALQIKPDYAKAQNDLAWLLATWPEASLRDGNKAVELAQQANALTGGENPLILHTLAAAFAEAGRFSEAVETAQRALQLAGAQSNTGLAGQLQSEMKLYQAGIPFHLPAQPH